MKSVWLDVYAPFGTSSSVIVDINDSADRQQSYCLKSFAGHSSERTALLDKAICWAKTWCLEIQNAKDFEIESFEDFDKRILQHAKDLQP